jgi:hypothetical protein
LGSKGVQQAGEEGGIGIKMVIVEIGSFVERATIGFAGAAVASEKGIPDEEFDPIVKGFQEACIHVRAEFTSQRVEDDRGMLAREAGQTFDFAGCLGAEKFGGLRQPEGKFYPEKHSHFVGDLKNILGRKPETKFHSVIAHCFEASEIGADAFRARVGTYSIRIPTPGEDKARIDGVGVEEESALVSGECTEAETDRFFIPIFYVEVGRVERGRDGRPGRGIVNCELKIVNG